MTKHRRLRRRTVTAQLSEGERKRRVQAYQRAYYVAHREEAKEYQRVYNLTYKKKQKRQVVQSATKMTRETVRSFKPLDLQQLDPLKIVKLWDRVCT